MNDNRSRKILFKPPKSEQHHNVRMFANLSVNNAPQYQREVFAFFSSLFLELPPMRFTRLPSPPSILGKCIDAQKCCNDPISSRGERCINERYSIQSAEHTATESVPSYAKPCRLASNRRVGCAQRVADSPVLLFSSSRFFCVWSSARREGLLHPQFHVLEWKSSV